MTKLFYDTQRRLIVYQTTEPDRVINYVPEARRVNGSHVAVPATLRNAQLLRILDLPIPGIMEASGYDWPIQKGRKPLPHQKLMAEFMVAHPRCFNLSDMGTMKTLATIWAADFVMQQEKCRAIVVAPLSILESVWKQSVFANLLGRRRCTIVHGSSKDRQKQLGMEADFYVINFDGVGTGSSNAGRKLTLGGMSADLEKRDDIQLVIVDEASAYRDSRTQRSKFAQYIFGRRSYLWQLTGSPTPNGPTDAYGLAKLAGSTRESFTNFHNRTMIRVSQFKWVPRPEGYREARKLLSPSIRFDLHDVWDGPGQTTQQRQIALTADQTRALKELKNRLQIDLQAGTLTIANEAAARLKAIQISLGAIYDDDHKAHRIDAGPRLTELKNIIHQVKGKLLCFVPLTSVVNLLHSELRKEVGCCVVNGQTPQRERADIFERFQSAESGLRLLIADPGTMAHGLDLWQARTVVWFGPTDRTELYLQANRRAYRPGQTWPVTVVQMVSTPLEKEIYRRLDSNETMQGVLLQLVREGKL